MLCVRVHQSLELDSSHELNHTASICALCVSECRALNIGAGIRIAVSDRLQLKNVENVESVHLETKHLMMVKVIQCDLLGEAHVGIEEARSAEAVAANAGHVVGSIFRGGRGDVEIRHSTFREVRTILECAVGAA